MPIDFTDEEFLKHGSQIIAQIEENFRIPKDRLIVEACYVCESLIAEAEGARMPIGVWRKFDGKQFLTSREMHDRQQQEMIRRLIEKSRYN